MTRLGFSASPVAPGAAHGGRERSGECRELGEAKRLQATYRGAEAQRFAQEPPPYGADWPEVADEADVIFAHVSEPHEACP
jgi:hypothetical protein